MLPTPKFIIPILNFFLSSIYVMQSAHWIVPLIWTPNSTYLKTNSSSFSSNLYFLLCSLPQLMLLQLLIPSSYLNIKLLECLLRMVSYIFFFSFKQFLLMQPRLAPALFSCLDFSSGLVTWVPLIFASFFKLFFTPHQSLPSNGRFRLCHSTALQLFNVPS